MYLFLICLLSVALVVAVSYISRFCNNPYTLHLVVGSKGSGKSLYMSKIADEWLKKHRGEVYSNMGIGNELKENKDRIKDIFKNRLILLSLLMRLA